jgi:peptidoglycan pentaglycine glycine transferase (the first glycine)
MAENYRLIQGIEAARWDDFVTAHPDAHTLQTADWGRLKSQFGWSFERVAVVDSTDKLLAGAQILFRRLPLRLGSMAYLPAGPLFYNEDPAHPAHQLLWQGINAACKRTIFLKVEPCNWYRPRLDLPAQLESAGLRLSPQTIQPPRTVVLDIADDDDSILKRMNQSTRRKVKSGARMEVTVREGTRTEIANFNALMAVTGERDKFGVHAPEYYQTAFDLFASGERCALLLASYAGQDLAGIMVFRCGPNAYYFYGASSNEERNRMPTYIVQWAALQWAKKHGATCYDLWGIPDVDETTLEAEFENRRDGLWGVYGFKRGFGGRVVRSVGAWDKVYNPLLYAGYAWYIRNRETGY